MPKPRKYKKNKQRREQSEFKELVLKIDRVNRVVKGGRRLRFRATVVVGNQKGLIGVGVGKSEEVASAVKKGVTKAKRNFQKIQIIDGTIAHQIQAKFKGSKVIMLPARQGTGIIAGGAIRAVAELAGIKNLLSKSHGSSNKINTSKATLLALESLKYIENADTTVSSSTQAKATEATVEQKSNRKNKETDKIATHDTSATTQQVKKEVETENEIVEKNSVEPKDIEKNTNTEPNQDNKPNEAKS